MSCQESKVVRQMTSTRFTVKGAVQGVGFRWAARDEADRLGIVGVVRNRDDGTVEVDAQGDEQVIAEFRAWLEHGPRWAEVQQVEQRPIGHLESSTFLIAH
jgi:acylphosphatase